MTHTERMELAHQMLAQGILCDCLEIIVDDVPFVGHELKCRAFDRMGMFLGLKAMQITEDED